MSQGSGNVSNIVNLGGVDTSNNLTIPEANTQGYFSLSARANAGTGTYSPFYKNGVLYQVTNGTTCKVVRVVYVAGDAGLAQLVHSLTTFAINAASITSGVFQGGAAANYVFSSPTASVPAPYSIEYDFPSQSYPGIQTSSGAGIVHVICKEV